VGARFLIAAGEPLKEPVAWGEPIVMNADESWKGHIMNLTKVHSSKILR
jgi:redox-sensitive bicupin YhaK (pirin superfamily)